MATKLQDLQWRACELVNQIVECDAPEDDRHRAIELVRKHLEARAEQTGGSIALADLLGDFCDP